MPRDVVTVDWEGRLVGAFGPAPLAELGPLGAAAQRDAAWAEGALGASAFQHNPRGVQWDRGDQRTRGARRSRRI